MVIFFVAITCEFPEVLDGKQKHMKLTPPPRSITPNNNHPPDHKLTSIGHVFPVFWFSSLERCVELSVGKKKKIDLLCFRLFNDFSGYSVSYSSLNSAFLSKPTWG